MATERRIALRHLDSGDPLDIDAYVARGGFEGFRKALAMDPGTLLGEIERSALRGRGGAGFPAGLKEKSTRASCEDCERFVVCNADEGEPGTFKDRIIMEGEPFILVEGMLISALAIGSSYGYLYIRGEYGLAIERMANAMETARARGFLGDGLFGGRFSFDFEIRKGAGSYLCGEELTLIESLEGKRGYPRVKPPFPAEKGLWGKPTLVNNVETMANLPWIAEHGADAYLAMGSAGSPGTKIFCFSGDVERPGFAELEMGLPLRTLIEDFAGGVKGGGEPLAVLLGGAAGTFVSGGMLDLAMDYDALKASGATLGSGAVIVMGRNRSLPDMLISLMDFFAHESCGKCVPCRVGTTRLARAAKALAALDGAARPDALEAMVAEAELMAKTSLCPLGQSPVLPLKSALRNLRGPLQG
ncbi:MAG: NADP oxidoreductase [Spirochaetia bacterium]|nr:NADP oxidoreductase [Spirochaetia bacterium]